MASDSNENEPYMSADEAANYLGIARQTVYNKCSRSELPHYKRDGLLRFKRSELDEWMRGHPKPTEEVA